MKMPPYMPLYVTVFEADTGHLTLAEDGTYNRLLRLCWLTRGCSIPDDPAWIERRMRCGAEEYQNLVAPCLREFFHRRNGRLFQKRQQKEWRRAKMLADKRSEAGRKGGRPRNPLKLVGSQ